MVDKKKIKVLEVVKLTSAGAIIGLTAPVSAPITLGAYLFHQVAQSHGKSWEWFYN